VTCTLFAGLFVIEKTSGMKKVIEATPLGREYTTETKVRITAAGSVMIAIVSMMPRLWQVYKGYGYRGLLSPLSSLDGFRNIWPIVPIIGGIIFMIMLRALTVFTLAMVTLYISEKSFSYLSRVMFSLVLFRLPGLLYYLGIGWVKYLTLYPLFHSMGSVGAKMNAFLAVVYSAICILTVHLCRRELIK
jgi:hypothetical protein